jgi:hypothetical protein
MRHLIPPERPTLWFEHTNSVDGVGHLIRRLLACLDPRQGLLDMAAEDEPRWPLVGGWFRIDLVRSRHTNPARRQSALRAAGITAATLHAAVPRAGPGCAGVAITGRGNHGQDRPGCCGVSVRYESHRATLEISPATISSLRRQPGLRAQAVAA